MQANRTIKEICSDTDTKGNGVSGDRTGRMRDNSFSLNPSKAFTDTHHLTSSQAELLIHELTDQKIPPVLMAQPDTPKGPRAQSWCSAMSTALSEMC